MSALTATVNGDNALIKWRSDRVVATLVRARRTLRDAVSNRAPDTVVVLFGDPTTDVSAQIYVTTVHVSPLTSTLAVSAVALVLEEMLGYSSQDPVMCALCITGSHHDAVRQYVRRVARRRAHNVFSMRAPSNAYAYSGVAETLQRVTSQLEVELGFRLVVEWVVDVDADV